MALMTGLRSRAAGLAGRLHREAPIEPEYLEWRELYGDHERLYADLTTELDYEGDEPVAEEFREISEYYMAGGDKYDPADSRLWLQQRTSLPDFRGTCLDVGSADGFWSIVLSEWYHVYGVEPAAGAVEVANAIKKRLAPKIAARIDYFVGDALQVADQYDVVFCRAPSFFNYPPDGSFSESLLDWDRSNLRKVFEARDPSTADQRVRAYPPVAPGGPYPYAHDFRWCLEQMLTSTGKLFIFIISTNPLAFGKFYGNTYAHDPDEIERVFRDYGETSVKLAENYIVAEIRDPRVSNPTPRGQVAASA